MSNFIPEDGQRHDGFWYFGLTDAYDQHRSLFQMASRLIALSDNLGNWIIENLEESEARHAYLTILSMANQALVSSGILCNAGYAGEARVQTRKIFEHWISSILISQNIDRWATLFNLNDRIAVLCRLVMSIDPEHPAYIADFPHPEATRQWMNEELNRIQDI